MTGASLTTTTITTTTNAGHHVSQRTVSEHQRAEQLQSWLTRN